MEASEQIPGKEIIEYIYLQNWHPGQFDFRIQLKEGISEAQSMELIYSFQQLLDKTVPEIKDPPYDKFTVGFSISNILVDHPDIGNIAPYYTSRQYGIQVPNAKWQSPK